MKSDLWTRDFDGFKKPGVRCSAAAAEELNSGTPATAGGNKFVLNHLRVVAEQDGQTLAEKEGLSFLETSALEALNIEKPFQTFLTEIYHIISKKALAAQEAAASTAIPGQGMTINVADSSGNAKRGCCST
ncbi:RAB GTPase-like protein A2B [Perilla frutescens var. hirtella]|nr:RAB GTPase-like protein A2B [Perilla frutescens var. hirtella]